MQPQAADHARQLAGLLVSHERDTHPAGARASGASDAVHVILARARHVVVDHVRNPRHVDPPCGDIRRHERVHSTGLEARERALALSL